VAGGASRGVRWTAARELRVAIANADSLVAELHALVADVKAHPKRYVNGRVF
jgi:hypothetical protein